MDKRLDLFSCRYFHLTAERLKCLVMVLKSGVHSLSFVHTLSNLVLIVYEVFLKLYVSLEFPYDMLHICKKKLKYFDDLKIKINFTCLLFPGVPVQSTANVSLNIKIPKQNEKRPIHRLCAFCWQLNAIVEASWVWIDASTCLCFGVSLMLC